MIGDTSASVALRASSGVSVEDALKYFSSNQIDLDGVADQLRGGCNPHLPHDFVFVRLRSPGGNSKLRLRDFLHRLSFRQPIIGELPLWRKVPVSVPLAFTWGP